MTLTAGAPLRRRLLAILYDSLALLGVLAAGALVWLPLNQGEAIAAGTLGFQLWLLALVYFYFVFSWYRGGQTLGMRAWKIRVVNDTGDNAGWVPLTLRFFASVLSWVAVGVGFLVAWRAPHIAWHDRLSGTRLTSAVPP